MARMKKILLLSFVFALIHKNLCAQNEQLTEQDEPANLNPSLVTTIGYVPKSSYNALKFSVGFTFGAGVKFSLNRT